MGTNPSKKVVTGDRVRVRDNQGQNWGEGVVATTSPVKVTLDNFVEPMEWKFVEPLESDLYEHELYELVPVDIWVVVLRFSHYHHQLKELVSEKYATDFVLRRAFKQNEQLWLPETIIFHKPGAVASLDRGANVVVDSSSSDDSWSDDGFPSYRRRHRPTKPRPEQPKSYRIGQTVYFVGASVYFGNGIEEGSAGVLKAVTTDHENDKDKVVVSFRSNSRYSARRRGHGRSETQDHTLDPSDISDERPRRREVHMQCKK